MGISVRQFEEMQERVSGKRRADAPVAEAVEHQIILGVDPSLRGTDYGVIQLGKGDPQTLAQGTIKCPARLRRSECLVAISTTLREVIQKNSPTACAISSSTAAGEAETPG